MQTITSVAITKYIEAGGRIELCEQFGEVGDSMVWVITLSDRDGTYIVDNAATSWVDASFDRVADAVRSGDWSELDTHGIAEV